MAVNQALQIENPAGSVWLTRPTVLGRPRLAAFPVRASWLVVRFHQLGSGVGASGRGVAGRAALQLAVWWGGGRSGWSWRGGSWSPSAGWSSRPGRYLPLTARRV